MINVNVSGTVTSVLTMYELMKSRGYGKIVRIYPPTSARYFHTDLLFLVRRRLGGRAL